jgi:Domain of unknown function (DUF4260)
MPQKSKELIATTITKEIIMVLRLEGGMVFITALCYYNTILEKSWSTFIYVFLLVDITLIGYLLGKRIGAVVYNIGHSYILPLLMFAISIRLENNMMHIISIIWVAHIGFDRAIGYGLKTFGGFKATHLATITSWRNGLKSSINTKVSTAMAKILKIEGLTTFVASMYYYSALPGASSQNLNYLALLLCIDFFGGAFLHFVVSRSSSVVFYNILHSYILPLLLLIVSINIGNEFIQAISTLWMLYIALRRAMGDGLEILDKIGVRTHLGPKIIRFLVGW